MLFPLALMAQINQAINSPRVAELENKSVALYLAGLPWFKALAILLTAFFIGGTIFFVIKTGWLALRVDRVRDVILKTNLSKKRSIKIWQRVKRYHFAGDDKSLKLAVLEADKALDEAIRLAGFRGETLGDRLKKITEDQLPNIQEIWEAHKLRNRLVHEPDFNLTRDMAEKALAVYEQTLKDLQLLD
jgi:hypothetical protein